MKYKGVKDVDVKGKNVLVRVDFNVPLDEDGGISDDLRIRAAVPTIEYLKKAGAAKIILISHLGRPGGKRVDELSLKVVAEDLAGYVEKVEFVDEVFGEEVSVAVDSLAEGGVLLLENLRFWPEEEKNDAEFIHKIIESTHAEIFVQDGFAVVHRAHASTEAVAKFLPVYAGLLVEKELENLSRVTEDPERPLLLLLGGAKGEDKAPLISRFVNVADRIAVGGKIAVDGLSEGINSEKIYVAEDFDEDSSGAKLDIGPVSMGKISEMIVDAKTIVWNGLLGKAEDMAFATSSEMAAELIGEKADCFSVICGGDTTGFVEKFSEEHPSLKYSLVSTGGGAALEFLAGEKLPGVEVIQKNQS